MATTQTLVWTICLYKNTDLDETEFHRYLSEHHAPMVKQIMVNNGITHYSMTHNTTATRNLLADIGTPQNEGFLDYDLITQIRVPDVQRLVDLKNDLVFKEKVLADNGRFTDPKRVFMTLGWVEDHIVDGRCKEMHSGRCLASTYSSDLQDRELDAKMTDAVDGFSSATGT